MMQPSMGGARLMRLSKLVLLLLPHLSSPRRQMCVSAISSHDLAGCTNMSLLLKPGCY